LEKWNFDQAVKMVPRQPTPAAMASGTKNFTLVTLPPGRELAGDLNATPDSKTLAEFKKHWPPLEHRASPDDPLKRAQSANRLCVVQPGGSVEGGRDDGSGRADRLGSFADIGGAGIEPVAGASLIGFRQD
jgi:hypothetical protein